MDFLLGTKLYRRIFISKPPPAELQIVYSPFFTYLSVHTHTKKSTVLIMDPSPAPLQSHRDRYCRPALVFKYTLRGRVSGPELPGLGQESW
jgi:hypothetical protein